MFHILNDNENNQLLSAIYRPKKFTLKGYKRYWFAYKDLYLYLYKSKDHFRSNQSPTIVINLRGCEVTPEVTLAQGKFNIKLEVPPEDGYGANNEMWIRCDSVRQLYSIDDPMTL